MPMSPEQHDEHMAKITAGLNQILESQDIDEVHTIAQGLLQEEQGEQKMDSAQIGNSLREKLMAAGGEQGQ